MKRIYIEGENDINIRKAFSDLFKTELGKNMPKIVMGCGISETVSKFRSTPLEQGKERFLLVDSDELLTDKADLVRRVNEKCSQKNLRIEATCDNTFFMVQEVEAWILSQPEALKQRKVIKGLPVPNITSIKKPSDKLASIYKQNGCEYHKVREFPKIFALLDSAQLKLFSPEYSALIEKLR